DGVKRAAHRSRSSWKSGRAGEGESGRGKNHDHGDVPRPLSSSPPPSRWTERGPERALQGGAVMTLRGQAAIVGIGEVPTRRTYPGRTTYSLCAEATRLAITDAGLRKGDLDGLVTRGSANSPIDLAEYMGLRVGLCEGGTQ